MSEPDKIISLVMGDWSGDGHSKTDTVVIKSNLTVPEITKAYKKASKKLGFDLIKEVAADYQDNNLSKDNMQALIKNGFSGELEDDEEEDNGGKGGYFLWTDSFLDIYLFIVKLGDPNFEYAILQGELNPSINIGGYGLYD